MSQNQEAMPDLTSDEMYLCGLAEQFSKFKQEGYKGEKLRSGMGHAYTVVQVSGWQREARAFIKKHNLSDERLNIIKDFLSDLEPDDKSSFQEFFRLVSQPASRVSENFSLSKDEWQEIAGIPPGNARTNSHYKYDQTVLDYAEKRHLMLP